MRSRATLELRFESAAEADRMAASLAPENGEWILVRVEGATLLAEADAAAPMALLHTLDDALACLGAAQKAGRAGAR